MISPVAVYLTIPLGLLSVFFYMRDMVRGTARPNRVSFLLWSLAPLIGAALSFRHGAGLGTLPVFLAGLNPLLILIFSFIKKGGYWKLGILDYVCGLLALVALAFWLLINAPVPAVIFAIFSDALACVPTLVKSWKEPTSEPWLFYVVGIIINTIGLLFLNTWNFVSAAFGCYLVLINIIITLSVLGRRAVVSSGSKAKFEKKPII